MFSGNFGVESEMREAQQHPTGRRHQPREMTDSAGMPTYYTNEVRQANEARAAERAMQEERAAKGPSFMDRMYANDVKPTADSPAKRPSGPRDQLNLFAWDAPSAAGNDNVPANRGRGRRGQQQQPSSLPPQQQSQTAMDACAPPTSHVADNEAAQPDAQARRAQECRKFEHSTDNHFLRFSEEESKVPPPTMAAAAQGVPVHTSKRVGNGRRDGQPAQPQTTMGAAYGSPQHGMMDALMRDQPAGRLSKRRGPEPRRANGPVIDGFPGMGQGSKHKPFQHLTRKQVTSNVFLPQLPDEAEEPPMVPPQRAHPQYNANARHRDDDDDDDTDAAQCCYHYSPAKGILPGRDSPDGAHDDLPAPGVMTRPEWIPHSHLEQGVAGLTPQLDADDDAGNNAPHSQRRHVNFAEQHAEIEQANPQRRTMLFKMRHQDQM